MSTKKTAWQPTAPDEIADELMRVLDHGFVRLVDHMGSDTAISRAARVSYNAAPRMEDAKLIAYLWRNKHTSPFEAVSFTFEIKAPLFIVAQWHRHRTWKYNQVSARYTELPEEVYIPTAEQITTQSKDNKQMRTADPHARAEDWRKMMASQHSVSFTLYRSMLDDGVPRELARTVLPTATYTRMFATVDLHNLFHFIRLRSHEHAQYEIRVYAQAMLELIRPIVPQACIAFSQSLIVDDAVDRCRRMLTDVEVAKPGSVFSRNWILDFFRK